jgi:hypothetical protein
VCQPEVENRVICPDQWCETGRNTEKNGLAPERISKPGRESGAVWRELKEKVGKMKKEKIVEGCWFRVEG